MALFRRRQTPAKAASPGSSTTMTPRMVEVLQLFDGGFASYGSVYRKLAPVRTVVDFLADAVSTTSLKMHERTDGGRPELREHPMARLLRNPNIETTQKALIGGTVRDLGVYGVGYWWKVQGPSRKSLVPLVPERMTPQGDDVLAPRGWWYSRWGAAPLWIPREDVVYFRLYNPDDRRIGASKLEALRTVLSEEVEVSRHRANFWLNAARREGVIEQAAEQTGLETDEDIERFRAMWRGKTSGARKAGQTAVLQPGMKWVPDSFSPKEAEFVEGRKFILEATARVFNVPVALLGLTDTATFASQREFHKALYQDTLPTWYQTIESEVNLQLLPWFGEDPAGDLYVEFEVESKLRGSFEEQASVIKDAVGRPWMTVEEVRGKFNLDNRGDPTDAELAIPVNNVQLGADAPPPPAAVPAPPAPPALQAASRVSVLRSQLERQQDSVLAKVGAGQPFDHERWNRELGELVAGWEEEVAT